MCERRVNAFFTPLSTVRTCENRVCAMRVENKLICGIALNLAKTDWCMEMRRRRILEYLFFNARGIIIQNVRSNLYATISLAT